jgi:hypothetical protein
MRKTIWTTISMIIFAFVCNAHAFAQGMSGFFDLSHGNVRNYENGNLISGTESFNRNLYLSLRRPITPLLSYQFNFRANLTDTDSIGTGGNTTSTYQRSLEPSLDLVLSNSMYNLRSGYRRQEQWTTAHFSDEGRITNELYYSRLYVTPRSLPTLILEFDRQKIFDHLSVKNTELTSTSYLIGTVYDLPSSIVDLRFNVNYSHDKDETPLNISNKSVRDNVNTNYNVGYRGKLGNRTNYSAGYQGNYSRSKTTQFVSQTGIILNERLPLAGLYALDLTPVTGALNSESALIDNDFATSVPSSIDIGTGTDHNIGILVSVLDSVDTIYIYTDVDITGDINLILAANWRVYSSNSNLASTTWTDISALISSVTAVADTINSKFRYEIKLSAPQKTSYLKVVNMAMVNAFGLTNVFVTEIEAYGSDQVDDDKLKTVSTSFNQQINLTAITRSSDTLSFTFNYYLDRADQNPQSVAESFTGIFGNIFSDTVSGDRNNFVSSINRNYGITTTWLTHRLVTTTFRVQRDETFDNMDLTDISSNTYNLSFTSEPLPTLHGTLSLIRSDNFDFGNKNTTSHSALLSIDSRLYREVNMVTDVSYTRSKSFISGTTTATRQLNGSIDANVTRKLYATMNYGLSWTESDDASSRSHDVNTIITYRPGRFISISGNLNANDADGKITTTEGLVVDWFPYRAIRLNLNYQHSNSDTSPSESDILSGYTIWYITKFADLRLTYGYTRQADINKTEIYSFNSILNCRF